MAQAPPTLLREVVGPAHSDDVLANAWRRSGGDLAAAVNIVLDGERRGVFQRTPAPAAAMTSGGSSSSTALPRNTVFPGPRPADASMTKRQVPPVVTTISLDDSDGEETGQGMDGQSLQSTAPKQPMSLADATGKPDGARTPLGGAWLPGVGQRTVASPQHGKAQPPLKRQRLETPSKVPQKTCGWEQVSWSFHIGTFEINAYSTVRISHEQIITSSREDEGGGRFLRPGSRLDLRWSVDVRKPKNRPGSVNNVSREGFSIRFSTRNTEVGKFPVEVARTLVPLITRGLIEVDALVGQQSPHALELGTTVPVVIHVSLHSKSLSPPSKVGSSTATGQADAGASGAASGSTTKPRAKGQSTVLKEEADQEVQRMAIAQLFEFLKLPRRRCAMLGDETGNGDTGDATIAPEAVVGGRDAMEEAREEDEEGEEEMSREAAVQLGGADVLERSDLPQIAMPSTVFASTLREYQAQAVYWLWSRENPFCELPAGFVRQNSRTQKLASAQPQGTTPGDKREIHPMWDEFELPAPVAAHPARPQVSFIYHHRTTGALSLDFPDASLATCRGGILADDMGLGKTVMCLALMSLDYAPDVPSARTAAPGLRVADESSHARRQSQATRQLSSFLRPLGGSSAARSGDADDGTVGGTLVVAPLSLMTQWHSEVDKHFPPGRAPTVHEYHGSGKNVSAEQLMAFGLVLTTFGTLSAEREDGPLFQLYWRRVVLDEAHSIKNRCSRMAQAAFRLNTFCRWCVTGTPLQNSVDELYSLVRFLRSDPWSDWGTWRRAITMPLERGRHGDGKSMSDALDAARRVMQPLLIRRTKMTKDPVTGEFLLKLPKKHVHLLELKLTLAERDFYDAVYTKAKTEFDTFVARGEALTKYMHVLQLILKLRQTLCHPFLVFARAGAKDEDLEALEQRCLQDMCGSGLSEQFVGNVLQELRNGELSDCPICCDTPEDPAMTPCGHIFCRECALKIERQCHGECPVCRRPGITKKTLKVLPGASRFPSRLLEKASASGDDGGAAHSTKMRKLLELVREDIAQGRRAVVFSQWTSFLDLISPALESAGVPWRRFDGSLSIEARKQVVAWLQEPDTESAPNGRVLLVSLKAGGVGLNLVAASRLYLMDLWWNPAVEEQAIQRVHRIGQINEVHVYKFIVEDTIDADLIELHKAKERLLEDAIRGGQQKEAATKLTLDDLKRLFSPCKSLKGLRAGGSTASNVHDGARAAVSAANGIPNGATAAASTADGVPDSARAAAGASNCVGNTNAGSTAVDVGAAGSGISGNSSGPAGRLDDFIDELIGPDSQKKEDEDVCRTIGSTCAVQTDCAVEGSGCQPFASAPAGNFQTNGGPLACPGGGGTTRSLLAWPAGSFVNAGGTVDAAAVGAGPNSAMHAAEGDLANGGDLRVWPQLLGGGGTLQIASNAYGYGSGEGDDDESELSDSDLLVACQEFEETQAQVGFPQSAPATHVAPHAIGRPPQQPEEVVPSTEPPLPPPAWSPSQEAEMHENQTAAAVGHVAASSAGMPMHQELEAQRQHMDVDEIAGRPLNAMEEVQNNNEPPLDAGSHHPQSPLAIESGMACVPAPLWSAGPPSPVAPADELHGSPLKRIQLSPTSKNEGGIVEGVPPAVGVTACWDAMGLDDL